MRKALVALAVIAALALGVGAWWWFEIRPAGQTKDSARITTIAPTRASSATPEAQECPDARMFDAAVRAPLANLPGITDSQLDSEIVCDGWTSAAWMKIKQRVDGKNSDGRVIVVLRQKADRAPWEVFQYSTAFNNEDSVCSEGTDGVVKWLRTQKSPEGRPSCTLSFTEGN